MSAAKESPKKLTWVETEYIGLRESLAKKIDSVLAGDNPENNCHIVNDVSRDRLFRRRPSDSAYFRNKLTEFSTGVPRRVNVRMMREFGKYAIIFDFENKAGNSNEIPLFDERSGPSSVNNSGRDRAEVANRVLYNLRSIVPALNPIQP